MTQVAKVVLQKSKFAGRHPTFFRGRRCFGFISLRIDSPLAFLLRGIRPYVQEAILGFILEVLSLLAPRSFFFSFFFLPCMMMYSCNEMIWCMLLMHMDEVKCICMKPKIFWPPVNFKP